MKKEETTGDVSYTRLNKFISNAGVCARRAADELIVDGQITVNGVKATTLGHKVCKEDVVMYRGKVLFTDQKVYVLLNKPKDYITTLDDPQERKTVMNLVKGACNERVYPVGRLDRHTTGLLLLTNDGELARDLAHPSTNIQKVYHVVLDKNLAESDLEKIRKGVMLEDGLAKVDDIHVDPVDRTTVGVEIHMGKNRVVRRIFEHLGYEVDRLDRTLYADLTKKNLPRGKWRMLTSLEIMNLKKITKHKSILLEEKVSKKLKPQKNDKKDFSKHFYVKEKKTFSPKKTFAPKRRDSTTGRKGK
jgi:23S rRNA pseudouridine2605 synthase